MKEIWLKYTEIYNERVIRERVIIAMCILAAVYFLWELAVLGGLRSKREALDARYSKATGQMQKLDAERKVWNEALRNNPNAQKQKQILELRERLTLLDKEIETLSGGLVSASKLPDVLRDVLLSRKNLSLVGMHALKPENLTLVSDSSGGDDSKAARVGIFKHRVILRLKGSYFAIRDYLAELEKSDWQFYWSSFDYTVVYYPNAIAQLEVYTLSTEKGFISD